MKKSVLLLTLFSLLFVSCRSKIEYETTKAELIFQLSTEGEFTEPIVKAEDDIKPDLSTFSLTVSDRATGDVAMHWEKFSDVPAVISMEPGVYTITAKSPGDKKAAWSQPIYLGVNDNVTVSAGKTNTVQITCRLSNMKVSINVTDRFIAEMEDDFSIMVDNGDATLTWNKDIIAAGQSGYFSVSPLTLNVKAIRRTTGKPISHQVRIEKVAAQDHHVLSIDASETGELELEEGKTGIHIDYTVNNKEENIVIDGLVEEPIDVEAPRFTQSSIAAGATDVPVTTTSVSLTYSTNVQLIAGQNITLNGAACTAVASENSIMITLPALTAGTAYTLAVPAGAVANSEDETVVANALTLTFTTAAEQGTNPEPPAEDVITITCPGVEAPEVFSASNLPDPITFTLDIEAENGIDSLVMTVDSPYLITLLGMMEETYGDLNPVDMAHMTVGQTEFWGGELVFNGLNSDDVYNKTSFSLDVAPFIPMIAELDSKNVTHDMYVRVVDMKKNKKEVRIQITMND